ncbi:trehalose-phosphatase [Gryllotalpicola ginsengisoli]|uniref:trehalose-phosphatase n=1 Tax=Gryllotalpicola ginsengisoli TaxID=444608 RepID=UPI0003B59416|nr:trehalose-phosphatase [Gryllotalpicola ginsengisoli]
MASELERVAQAPDLLVALDFDGTVSPLVDDPAESRLVPAAAAAIARLRALPRTWVAFVSGRPLASLARVTGADDDALLIGSHGVEVRIGGAIADLGLSAEERGRLVALESKLAPIVAGVPEAYLEHKPVGFGVHTRRVRDKSLVPGLHAAARTAAADVGGFTERDGKDILEFSVRDVTKGDGVRALRELLGDEAQGDVTVVYAGDDVTDEDAFAVLGPGDLGVKVGPGETRAAERVADVPAFAEWLTRLADAREASVSAD